MKKILLITPFYYAEDIGVDATPVVNYFTKEWVKAGHRVIVVHTPSVFPYLMRSVAKPFKKRIEARLNCTLFLDRIEPKSYEEENGVTVLRHPLNKVIPHSRYSKKQINDLLKDITSFCQSRNFQPDVIIGHWVTPTIDIVLNLKDIFSVKTAVVLHNEGAEIKKLYKDDCNDILSRVDAWGFRSEAKRRIFEKNYGRLPHSFICYSGIPSSFVEGVQYRQYSFSDKYIFVGVLRERKYPATIIDSLVKAYGDKEYSMIYIGEGAEETSIREKVSFYNVAPERVRLLGKVAREEVRKHLSKADVFVMVSRAEAFGLVYLEAMSTGCIPIASKNEGFDGIIKDGVNGFLCTAGDATELADIIKRIQSLSKDELQKISNAAVDTAKNMKDEQVAKRYLESIENK